MSNVFYLGKQAPSDHIVEDMLSLQPKVVAIDIETISLKERMPLGFSVAFTENDVVYFPVYPEPCPEVELVKPLLLDRSVKKVAHNAMFDLDVMPLIYQIDRSNIADTNVMARLLGNIYTSLKDLSLQEFGIEVDNIKDLLDRHSAKTCLDVGTRYLANKCMVDSRMSLLLYNAYKPRIEKLGLSEYLETEMRVIPILIDMSGRGLKVDQSDRADLETKYEAEVEFYRAICEKEKFNPGSNQQSGYILAKRGNFLPLTRSKKQLRCREEDLEFLDDPLASAIIGYRKASKFLNTYVKPLASETRIFTEFNLDAVVGRISSSNRNLQNIPPDARYIFVPDNGMYTTGDFSQEHLRLIMHRSGDAMMKRVYEDGEMGGDIHSYTARELGITRRLAKVVNFAIPYGATPKAVSMNAKIKDVGRCAEYLSAWFKLFSGAHEWIIEAQREGLRSGWALPTEFGRRIKIPEEDEEGMKRKAVNYPILGSDGEVMKRALIIANRAGIGPPTMAVTVHDSITWDGDVLDQIPVEELESIVPNLRIPFEIKQTLRWE